MEKNNKIYEAKRKLKKKKDEERKAFYDSSSLLFENDIGTI